MQRRLGQSNRDAGAAYAYILMLVPLTRVSAAAASDVSAITLSMRHERTHSLHANCATNPRPTPTEHRVGWLAAIDREIADNPTVRRHVRCWLLGLISFGPVTFPSGTHSETHSGTYSLILPVAPVSRPARMGSYSQHISDRIAVTDRPYIAVVERAQRGDLAAFAELVVAFQDLAVGTAFGWLGEIELARDATQEAFLDAHLHLRDLREPAAFPAWLRTLVVKHCDRVTRRPRMVLAPLEFRTTFRLPLPIPIPKSQPPSAPSGCASRLKVCLRKSVWSWRCTTSPRSRVPRSQIFWSCRSRPSRNDCVAHERGCVKKETGSCRRPSIRCDRRAPGCSPTR